MTARHVARAGLWVLTATLAGCVMPDQVSQVQKDVADVRLELRQAQREQREAKEKLDRLATDTARSEQSPTRTDVADLQARLDQVARDVAIAGERLNEMDRRFGTLAQDVQQTRDIARRQPVATLPPPPDSPSGTAPTTPGVGTAQPDAQSLYNTAYADFSKGNYALAIAGFEEYRERFPGSAEADNALYWVGECQFSQGAFQEAIGVYDRLLESYPQSDKAAAANLKKALAYLETNRVGQAIVQLRYVVSTYPGTDESRIARDKLTSLGG